MSREYFYGAARKPAAAARIASMDRRPDVRGTRATGRVARLMIGQGHGFIRLNNQRDVFFHRADVMEGTAFNALRVGDAVIFELFEDAVSGARALHVGRRKRSG